jgi:hypothetical protein
MNNPDPSTCEDARLRCRFEGGLDELTGQCWWGRLCVRELRVLGKCLGQYPTLMKTDPALFKLAHHAIAGQVLMIAARLVDTHKDAASVYWFLNFVEQNATIFPYPQNVVMTWVKADRQRLSDLEEKIGKLTAIRDKHYAHIDKEYLMQLGKLHTEYPFLPDDAEELYMAVGGILNRYSGHLRDSATRMEAVIGEGHTEWLLGFLSKSLEAANTHQQAELQRLLDDLYHITEKGFAIQQQEHPQPLARRPRAD